MVDALRAHGLVDRALVSSQCMRSLVRVRARRAAAAARLVGAARQARLHEVAGLCRAALRGAALRRRRLPGTARRHIARGPLRRDHGPLPAGDRRGSCARCARPAATSTSGRSTTPRTSAASRRWASTGVITNDPRLFGSRARSVAALSSPPGRPAGRESWPAVVVRRACRTMWPLRRQRKRTTPRSVTGPAA